MGYRSDVRIVTTNKGYDELKKYTDNYLKENNFKYDNLLEACDLFEENKYSKYFDQYRFIVTGDMVNSPSDKNNDEYNKIQTHLETLSTQEVITILGNHDVNTSGLKILPKNHPLLNNHLLLICLYHRNQLII